MRLKIVDAGIEVEGEFLVSTEGVVFERLADGTRTTTYTARIWTGWEELYVGDAVVYNNDNCTVGPCGLEFNDQTVIGFADIDWNIL